VAGRYMRSQKGRYEALIDGYWLMRRSLTCATRRFTWYL